jgi:hypothetical protein
MIFVFFAHHFDSIIVGWERPHRAHALRLKKVKRLKREESFLSVSQAIRVGTKSVPTLYGLLRNTPSAIGALRKKCTLPS